MLPRARCRTLTNQSAWFRFRRTLWCGGVISLEERYSCFNHSLDAIADLAADLAGPIEEASKVADADYACDVYACRGYQFEDNESALQTYQAGDVVSFHVDLIAGHRPGYAVRGLLRTDEPQANFV